MKKQVLIYFLPLLLAFQAKAQTIEQTFDVKIGVFDAVRVTASYTLLPNEYHFVSDIYTSGIFDKLYSFKARYLTAGQIGSNGQFITKQYDQKTKSSSHIRTKSLLFDDDGILIKRISAKDGLKKIVPVIMPNARIDAYDMQTVLSSLLDQFRRTSNCSLNKTVFNGKKIYHINIKDEGTVDLKNKDITHIKDVHRCVLFISQENAQKGDLLWQSTAGKKVVFYLSKEKNTKLPVLLQTEITSTPLGSLKAYATDIKIKD